MARTVRTAVATLVVRVPLNASGSLVDGATRVVERIDAVEHVEDPEVTGLTPSLNDTTVTLRARVTVLVGDRGEDVPILRRELEDGVGIRDVEAVEAVEPDGPPVNAAPAGAT